MTQAETREFAVEMRGPCRRIRSGIELESKPGEPLAYTASDDRGVLADAGREDEAVDAAHGGGKRARLAQDAVDEIVDREPGERGLGREQVAHIVADAGEALQPAFLIEEPLEPRGIPALLVRR